MSNDAEILKRCILFATFFFHPLFRLSELARFHPPNAQKPEGPTKAKKNGNRDPSFLIVAFSDRPYFGFSHGRGRFDSKRSPLLDLVRGPEKKRSQKMQREHFHSVSSLVHVDLKRGEIHLYDV